MSMTNNDDLDKLFSARPLQSQKQLWAVGIAFLLLLGFALVVFFNMLAPFLIAVAMGCIGAVLVLPAYSWLLQRGFKPRVAAWLITLGVFFLVAVPSVYFVNAALEQATVVGQNLLANKQMLQEKILGFMKSPMVARFIPDEALLHEQLIGWVQQAASYITTGVVAVASSVPESIVQILLAIMTMFYGLIDGQRFVRWISSRDILDRDTENKLIRSIRDTAISSVWAGIVSAGVQALIIWLGCLIVKSPAPFLLALATFIAAWIPLLGTTIVTVPLAVGLFFGVGPTQGITMLVVGALCGVSDNVTRPWVLHGRSAMHPLVGLLAIFGGLQMFGFYGVFLGPIFTGFVITLLQAWPNLGRRLGILGPSDDIALRSGD